MAVRSTHLLEQIQDLRAQLAVYECSSVDNLQKSAKKARKKQRTEQQVKLECVGVYEGVCMSVCVFESMCR